MYCIICVCGFHSGPREFRPILGLADTYFCVQVCCTFAWLFVTLVLWRRDRSMRRDRYSSVLFGIKTDWGDTDLSATIVLLSSDEWWCLEYILEICWPCTNVACLFCVMGCRFTCTCIHDSFISLFVLK